MNLTEVIAALNEIIREHPEAADKEVVTEGCDCLGDVGSVFFDGYFTHINRYSEAPDPQAAKVALDKLAVQGLAIRPKEHVKIWPPST